jgi:hypothetical protein
MHSIEVLATSMMHLLAASPIASLPSRERGWGEGVSMQCVI